MADMSFRESIDIASREAERHRAKYGPNDPFARQLEELANNLAAKERGGFTPPPARRLFAKTGLTHGLFGIDRSLPREDDHDSDEG